MESTGNKIAMLLLVLWMMSESTRAKTYNVLSYGAVGDGHADDSQAFGKAWEAACGAKSSTPTLEIPKGKTFLLGPTVFSGPCKSPTIQVKMDGNLVAPSKAWSVDDSEEDKHGSSWIEFVGLDGLVVAGTGQVDGKGSAWWTTIANRCDTLGNKCTRPAALRFYKCTNLRLEGFHSINSPKNHISLTKSSNVHVSSLRLTAPETSPNTDGFDIAESTNVLIQHTTISTGDDCVAINTGSSYINITNVACGPGHGISVGSLGKDGAYATVEEVHVSNCSFIGTKNGARIKTWQGGSGYARKITFDNIILDNTDHPIIIDQSYCPHGACKNQEEAAVKISEVWFTEFQGTSMNSKAITLNCSETVGCTGINLDVVNLTASEPDKKVYAYCTNAHGSSKDTYPPVNCLLP